MARMVTQTNPIPVSIENFLGLNEDSASDTQLKLGESPSMTNFRLTENYKLDKREGYYALVDSLSSSSIQGLFYGKFGGSYHFLIAHNGTIYDLNRTTDVLTSVGTYTSSKVNFFVFNNKVYMVNGFEYKSWTGTGSFVDVAGYVPLIATATPPTGGGSDNEGINLLTGKKRQSFSGNGTATYTLRESAIDSVDSVYVGGVLKTVTTHYTVNLTAGTITFTTGNIPATGVDNVVIAWTKGTGYRSEVTTYKFSMLYGGQNDNRVFLYGNGTNKYIYSGLADGVPSAEYFPALYFQTIGSSDYAVTDIVRQYDRQIIFTDGQDTWYSSYDTITDAAGNVIPSFPTYPLNDAVGNVAYGQAQVVQNNPFSIQNGVYEWTGTNVRDERNVAFKSKRVQPSLNAVDLTTAITVDWEHKKEYWLAVGNIVWVYNYLVDAWYKFELNHIPTCFMVVDNQLYFGTTTGRVMQFLEGLRTDDELTVTSHWESGFYDFGASYLQKFLNRMWISLKPGSSRRVQVSWQTDAGSSSAVSEAKYRLFSYNDIQYEEWSYQTQYNPQPFLLKVKAKKFVYFKLILENNDNDSDATILGVNLLVQTGGESK